MTIDKEDGVIAALSGSNILKICHELQKRYPDKMMIICGDTGSEEKFQYTNFIAIFPKNRNLVVSNYDFNDLHKDKGILTIKYQLKKGIISEEKGLTKNDPLTMKEAEYVVHELNIKHAVVHIEQFHIMTEKWVPHQQQWDIILESKSSLRDCYQNQKIWIKEGNANCKQISKADIWLSSPLRRGYNGLFFHPKKPLVDKGYYNLYRGLKISPKKGDTSIYWDFVLEVICSGKKDVYSFLRKWLANLIQNPDKIGTALIFRGRQGVGKDTFIKPLQYIFGKYYILLSDLNQILGRFNGHLKNVLLVYANEALWGGTKSQKGRLKSLITEDTIFIESKGIDGFTVNNFKHLIISSNENWAVPLDHDDRRFYAIDVPSMRKGDRPYFNKLYHFFENGGAQYILYDLLEEDLSGFDPKEMPKHYYGFDMKLESAITSHQYIYFALCAGSFDIGNVIPTQSWPDQKVLSSFSIYTDYLTWCETSKKRSESKHIFFKEMKYLIGGNKQRLYQDERRIYSYTFESLDKCRKQFESKFKVLENIWLDLEEDANEEI